MPAADPCPAGNCLYQTLMCWPWFLWKYFDAEEPFIGWEGESYRPKQPGIAQQVSSSAPQLPGDAAVCHSRCLVLVCEGPWQGPSQVDQTS